MRDISVEEVTKALKELSMTANFELGKDVFAAFEEGLEKEVSQSGRAVFEELIENAKIANEERVPMCQDTGLAVVFLDIGQDVHLAGGDLTEAVNEGVRQGYLEGYLRKSSLDHPIRRKNTGDNTPAIIHTRIVPGDKVRVTLAPKGGGSENMSRIAMMPPSKGHEGVVDFVVDVVRQAGSNPCPPIVVGVGLGGTFEYSAVLAKRALLRELGKPAADADDAEMEKEIFGRIKKLGIGPQGFGGRYTALGVHIESANCHLASLPVAVNIQCHAARHKEVVI
ncbi:MAG: fumarate hydratase [Planctomycetota bacterium]|jgi:fumarate hydratase subunit alpha